MEYEGEETEDETEEDGMEMELLKISAWFTCRREMSSRPELQAPPEIFYDDAEARKYTSSRIIEIQAKISERALELLNLPNDGVPRLLLDIRCGSGLSGEMLSENGHQWIDYALCNADKSSHEPRLRLKVFFGSLYRCLSRGARARELILGTAMRAGFAGGVVVDYPHGSKSWKEYLVLTCDPSSLSTSVPSGKGEDGESCSDEESSGDEEDQTVCVSDRHRPRKRQKTKKGKGRAWLLKKKEQMRIKGNVVPPDTKYTGRKRKLTSDLLPHH
ncbi:18S rRNA (guanine(1575)-N(7))-methyltransferase Bud23, C-terminal [Dillenia turbinata]|uniref:18S rRNA (Guanine(1575)-N(7))-methyltransferase Bud23, C-terminal n=1 Tax=Dillenia turbinata TaxID=194707 RepID=A0AAN8WBS8_9MAGN